MTQRLRDCAFGLVRCFATCLLQILLLPIVIPAMLIAAIFFLGPLIYYRSTVFDSAALAAKYASDGIGLRGRVVKRWMDNSGEHGPTYHVCVAYKIGDEEEQRTVYTNKFVVSRDIYDLNELELIRLPNYPRSAVLRASIQGFDENFPPSKVPGLVFAFSWVAVWNFVPLLFVLDGINCSSLLAPVFFGMVGFEFFIGYWVAQRDRDKDLRQTLYGAKKVTREQQEEVIPRSISYKTFFDEEAVSCIHVIGGILLDLTLVISWILVIVYFLAFGGGHLVMNGALLSSMKQKVFDKYDSQDALRTTGSIATRLSDAKVLVQYEVQSVTYKKIMQVPRLVNRDGRRRVVKFLTVPDNPELKYLANHPASAELKCRIDRRAEDMALSHKRMVCSGLFCMVFQIALPTLIIGGTENTTHFGLIAGIVTVAHILLSCIGSCIQYRFFFLRNLLQGAKAVDLREQSNDLFIDEPLPEIDSGTFSEFTGQTKDETAASETDENAFVTKFMAGRFPRLDQAFVHESFNQER